MTQNRHRLRAVKVLHTVVWAFFAGCIVAIPPVAWSGRLGIAWLLVGAVAVEVVVLAANAWHCPLTAVAARHTDDRRANFDIYLPEWLARHNKVVFGSLYAFGVLLTVLRWLGASA
ncbi:MAG TPA: hypothetical protein VFZ65_11305 [Planctomycetota bacterium]|nr:hypothetical protein [Planctomycetota bacterium]